ncbi:hypothetical protein J6590_037854, partial [Homalodisca vitripennis]
MRKLREKQSAGGLKQKSRLHLWPNTTVQLHGPYQMQNFDILIGLQIPLFTASYGEPAQVSDVEHNAVTHIQGGDLKVNQ